MYTVFITILSFIEKIGALFNHKLSLRATGLSNWEDSITATLNNRKSQDLVWCHCSSLGEYEQAIPVLQYLKSKKDVFVLVSFYSPSGYEYAKDASWYDAKCYLPVDTKSNASRFIGLVQPKVVLWTKYDFWYSYYQELHDANIPILLFSAAFRADQYFFKNYGSRYLKILADCHTIFVQDKESIALLNKHKIANVQLSGDTRIDRVLKRKEGSETDPLIRGFMQERKCILLASTHPEGVELIQAIIKNYKDYNIAIFPHEVDDASVDQLISNLDCTIAKWSDNKSPLSNVLVVNTIGLLFDSYRYAYCAYVGGGFGKSIHNILEPTVFGVPVIIGPAFDKFKEARELKSLELISVLDKSGDIINVINDLDQDRRQSIKTGLETYYSEHSGATDDVGSMAITLLNNQ